MNDSDRYEDLTCYDLYDLIFKIGKENLNVVFDITAEIVLLFIKEICSSEMRREIPCRANICQLSEHSTYRGGNG